jgi:hypothetical protein
MRRASEKQINYVGNGRFNEIFAGITAIINNKPTNSQNWEPYLPSKS